MYNIEFILFDCMETLVDMTELPALEDYAFWTWQDSGVEGYWKDFNDFFKDYTAARAAMNEKYGEYREYDVVERTWLIVRSRFPGMDPVTASGIVGKLNTAYWKAYKSRCYVKDDVREALPKLAARYGLGVVSNFMVSGGIEELLREHAIIHSFQFILTSIGQGWRKPYADIYDAAIEKAGAHPSRIAFVGDDYENDYIAPGKIGMTSILLDKLGHYPDTEKRIRNFYELAGLLL